MSWPIYKADHSPHDGLKNLPAPPGWRRFGQDAKPAPPNDLTTKPAIWQAAREKGRTFHVRKDSPVVEAVNAALYLRRPLLITGPPGSGKSTLIHSVAYELQMGPVLVWPITSRSTLRQGIYEYDALARLQAVNAKDPGADQIGNFIHLNPLGAALHGHDWPRALLIDEIDKSDLDLPNDLLHILEEGRYEIPELQRRGGPATVRAPGLLPAEQATVIDGLIACRQFPFIVMTSNGEREFPGPFLRRCIRLDMPKLTAADLEEIVKAHLGEAKAKSASELIERVMKDRDRLTIDQLLNAVYITLGGRDPNHTIPADEERKKLNDLILKPLQ